MSVVYPPQSLLKSLKPSVVARAFPLTVHHQLRDSLLICPRETGILNYVVRGGIVEHDVRNPGVPLRVISNLTFTPTSITSLPVHGGTLIAAGGLSSELYLSYHVPLLSDSPEDNGHTRVEWDTEYLDDNGQINNSVLLTSAINLSSSNQSSAEPRLLVSNNDHSTRFYDVPLHNTDRDKLHEVGRIQHDVPVNYSSVSPDGRTLVSVCDSHDIHLHDIKGGGLLSFEAMGKLKMPPSDAVPLSYAPSSYNSLSSPIFSSTCQPVYSPWACPDERSIASPLRYAEQEACFSAAFTQDGSKFAVASQQGAVAVWDVKKLSEPLKVFHTNKLRSMGTAGRFDGGNASGWLTDPWGWIFDHGGFGPLRTPEWSVRSVKFSSAEGRREIMAFTEHTSLVHIVDAVTFEDHETVVMPTLVHPLPPHHNSYPTDTTLAEHKYFEDLELAGMCFDPQGKTMYAAGAGYGIPSVLEPQGPGVFRVGAVAAWNLRGDSGPNLE